MHSSSSSAMLKRTLSRQWSFTRAKSIDSSHSASSSRSTSPTLDTDVDSDHDLLEMLCSEVLQSDTTKISMKSVSVPNSPRGSITSSTSDCADCQLERILAEDNSVRLAQMLDYGELSFDTCGYGSLLHKCVHSLSHRCVQMVLLSGRVDVNEQDAIRKETPLHVAVRTLVPGKLCPETLKIVKVLIHAGSDVNMYDFMGRSPLHISTEIGSLSVVKVLCEAGAYLDIPDASGMRPLDYARNRAYDGSLILDVMMRYKGPDKPKEETNACVRRNSGDRWVFQREDRRRVKSGPSGQPGHNSTSSTSYSQKGRSYAKNALSFTTEDTPK